MAQPAKVLKIEDIIGFKLQAIVNNEKRRAIDLADIESLMELRGSQIDWSLVKEYFLLFEYNKLFNELKKNMAKISDVEKIELLRLVKSKSMKKDMELISHQRHNPVIIDGKISMDRLVEFLTQFNEFINHEPKPFEPIIDKDMRL